MMDVKALNMRSEGTHPMTRSLLRDAMATLKKPPADPRTPPRDAKPSISRDKKPDRRG